MILIGPGTIILLALLMFRPIRRLAAFCLLATVVFFVAYMNGWIGP